MAKQKMDPLERTLTISINPRVKSVENALRRELERLINPWMFDYMKLSKDQLRMIQNQGVKTIEFTEKVVIKNEKVCRILLPGPGRFDCFIDPETGYSVKILEKNISKQPSLVKFLEKSKGVFLETENWAELLMLGMDSFSVLFSGRCRKWKFQLFLEKKPGTKQTYLISEVHLDQRMLKRTKDKKKQF